MSKEIKMVDVTLHIDEDITHDDREDFRNTLLDMTGVMAAACHDEKPHLMVIEYDPDAVSSKEFVVAAQSRGYHSELIGL